MSPDLEIILAEIPLGLIAAPLLWCIGRSIYLDWRADRLARTAQERLYLRYGVLLWPDMEAAGDPSDPRRRG